MGASLERCKGQAWVLRAGPEHSEYGDPYSAAGTVDVLGSEATVKGFMSLGFRLKDWFEIRKLLKPLGVKVLKIERIRGDRITEHEWRL